MAQKTLLAVVNCRERQNTWAQAVRQTWLPQVPSDRADIKFFVGRGEGEVPSDTVALDCNDSYQGLPEKVQCIARYALNNDYEYVVKIDDDVVLKPHTFLDSDYTQFPYTGRANRKPTNVDPFWVPMGFCYIMNRECMQIVSDTPIPPNNDDERWVAETLHRRGIDLHDSKKYYLYMGGLIDRPRNTRVNRPLRVGKAAQDESKLIDGLCWCVFTEVGGQPFRVPVEEKLRDFHGVFQRFGEK